MKTIALILTLGVLLGCSKSVPKVQTVPAPKVTKTITETTQVDTPVPVYRNVSTISSQTKTVMSDGTRAQPLHEVTVKGTLPEPK